MAQTQFRSDDTVTWQEGFGSGKHGSVTVTADATFRVTDATLGNNANCFATFTGTTGNTTGTAVEQWGFSTTYMASGDLVLIHQTEGTSAGVWELNRVTGGLASGTQTIILKYALKNTYGTGAQIVRCPEFNDFTINSGKTLYTENWRHAGATGGIMAVFVRGTTTIAGTINGSYIGLLGGSQTGNGNYEQGRQGEGTGGPRDTLSTAANGNGGGGGHVSTGDGGGGGGGGGGHSTGGGNGGNSGTAIGGTGGGTAGNAGLTNFVLGGGGGSGSGDDASNQAGSAGGAGGAGIFIFTKTLATVTGSIVANGANGTNYITGYGGTGAGGSGGSILIKGQSVDIGVNKLTVGGGSGGSGNGNMGTGGAGGIGRIHVDYKDAFNGSTSPTVDSRVDNSLLDLGAAGGSFFWNLI